MSATTSLPATAARDTPPPCWPRRLPTAVAPSGLARVLITCAEPNTASRQVIENNGGILENTLNSERRYWVDLTQNPPPAW